MAQVTDFCNPLTFDHVLIKNNPNVDYYTSSKKKRGPFSQRFPKMFPKIELKICLSCNLGSS